MSGGSSTRIKVCSQKLLFCFNNRPHPSTLQAPFCQYIGGAGCTGGTGLVALGAQVWLHTGLGKGDYHLIYAVLLCYLKSTNRYAGILCVVREMRDSACMRA